MMVNQTLRADSKVLAVCQQIRQMALMLAPDERLPTVNELCAQLATSRVTLTEALKELERQQVIYRQQSKGIFVSPHLHRKNIGILFDSANFITSGASPFWGMLWGLFAQEAHRREETGNLVYSFYASLRTAQQPQASVEFSQLIADKRLHGALFIGLFEPEFQQLIEENIPCVGFAGPGRCSVTFDMEDFVRQAVRKISTQHCRRVAFWMPSFLHDEMADLFSHVQADRALIFDQVLVHTGDPALTLQEQGLQIALDTFRQPEETWPDGIIVLNDLMTDGILAAFQVLGVQLGTRTHVVTYGNAGSMLIFNAIPGMAVLEFDPADIVSTMFALLDTMMAGEKPAIEQVKITSRFRQKL